MDKDLAYINDFINIETVINNECYEGRNRVNPTQNCLNIENRPKTG